MLHGARLRGVGLRSGGNARLLIDHARIDAAVPSSFANMRPQGPAATIRMSVSTASIGKSREPGPRCRADDWR